MVACLVAVSGIAYSETKPADTNSADAMKERLAPVGKTCMSGESCAAAPAAPASAGPKSGKEVFSTTCTNCHSTGLLGSPKFGNAADWAPRAAKGLDTLFTHALGGFNSMPPRGTCAACSDDEVKAAVKYMVESSK